MNQLASLSQAAQSLGLTLSPAQLRALTDYLAMIAKWNKVYNLTAVRDPADMLTHHVLDSLAALPALQHQLANQPAFQNQSSHSVLDVGSGAGLPGVVFAICDPTLQVTCVDTVGKKVAFVQQAALVLKLPNLKAVHARVETLKSPFDVVCSRAFASLKDFTDWSANALAGKGVWMAMKGKQPADEIAALSAGVKVFHVEQLTVPELDAERCIVWMQKSPA
jgi:16S rRNA (guanine527-N7)-methyltransferase